MKNKFGRFSKNQTYQKKFPIIYLCESKTAFLAFYGGSQDYRIGPWKMTSPGQESAWFTQILNNWTFRWFYDLKPRCQVWLLCFYTCMICIKDIWILNPEVSVIQIIQCNCNFNLSLSSKAPEHRAKLSPIQIWIANICPITEYLKGPLVKSNCIFHSFKQRNRTIFYFKWAKITLFTRYIIL